MNIHHFAAASMLAIAAAAPALAEEGDVVVTASRVEQASSETGQHVTVIDRATIDLRQTVTLSDLLATTPGVTVSRSGGIGTQTAVRIRGAEGEQTLVLIDGVRVNDPSSPGGAFDFANLLSSSVERVEVLRGPGSVVWGSQALGGVVNILTRRPPAVGTSLHGGIEYGDNDTLFAHGGVAGTQGAVSGALTAGYLTGDGISAAASGSERDGYRQYGASGRVEVTLAEGIAIDLRGYWADSRTELDGFPAPRYVLADDREYSTAQELYGYAGLRAELFDGRLRNRIAFTVADIDRDNFDPSAGTAPIFFGRGRSERYEYQGQARLGFVDLVAGAEHEDSRLFDGSTRASVGVTSFYGKLIAKPVPQLTLTAGVRHDDHERFGGHTSFAADGVLALDTGTLLRASYAEGFKAPTLYQLYSFYGNATLQPETASSYDFGVEQLLLDGRIRAGATWFHRDTTSQIDFANLRYVNIARTRTRGVEMELAVRPNETLEVTGSYTWMDPENRSPGANLGRDLGRRPRYSASGSVDWRSPWGVSLGGTLSMVGDSFDDAANRTRLDGYALASIRAELPVGERLSVYARLENAFAEKYQTVAGYGTLPRTATAGIRVRLN